MIKKIIETVENNTLKISVECSIREYAKYPIKILTTEKIIGIIKNKYNIVKILKSPRKQIGNTKNNYMTNSGTWLFEILLEEKEIIKNEPKPAPAKKRSATTRKKPASSSIRSRMSKLAAKED